MFKFFLELNRFIVSALGLVIPQIAVLMFSCRRFLLSLKDGDDIWAFSGAASPGHFRLSDSV